LDLIRSRAELGRLDALRGAAPLCFVPTMGALHEGHLDLVRRARILGPTVVSIFVNPTQFGPGEDLERYPRDLAADSALLEPLGVDAVFAPPVEEMYAHPDGVSVRAGLRSECLCGVRRLGHFDGVVTVVAKLFNMVRPDVAVFGRKDAQQCLVIDEMVRDLGMNVVLMDAPTVREDDGLALSSRNRFLDPVDRGRALGLSRALGAARRALESGEREVEALEEIMALHLADVDVVDYAEIRTVPELERPALAEGNLLLAIAAHVGRTRLIDNLVLEVDGKTVREAPLLEG
jgi:pantoate--beta-alanine ligase